MSVSKLNTFCLSEKLAASIKNIYQPAGLKITKVVSEDESLEYEAYRFELSGCKAVFRAAKTTPNKIGQFVTIWKRPTAISPIMPFDIKDDIDFIIISTTNGHDEGNFIFSKHVLVDQEIISANGKDGKRAIRVYPPWSKPVAPQAIKTQSWQLKYFLSFGQDCKAMLSLVGDYLKN